MSASAPGCRGGRRRIRRPCPIRSTYVAHWVLGQHARELGIRIHGGVTYACIEGPRLGTQVESRFLRQAGCDLAGMANVPDAFLAREAQICYATIGIVTDYDCWMEDPSKHVTASSIFDLYRQSLQPANRLLHVLLTDACPPEELEIRNALSHAMLTPDGAPMDAQRTVLSMLKR
jgi:5'-methylthioadenosine phosphorylase